MNIDQAMGYLLRDPRSVEAEAARVLSAEILARGQEIGQLQAKLARIESAAGQARRMLASQPSSDCNSLESRACSVLAAALKGEP